MNEILNKSVRLSASVKLTLDNLRGTQNINDFMHDLLTSYEVGNLDQKRSMKMTLENISKRIEDLVKIVKTQERDIFRPVLTLLNEGEIPAQENEQAVRLANENIRLQTDIENLKKRLSSTDSDIYRNKLSELSRLIIVQCDPERFNTVTLGSDLKVSPSFFRELIKVVKENYVL